MPPSELRVSLNGKTKRRVVRTNMVGIPTRTRGFHLRLIFPRRASPKKIGVRRVEGETDVSMQAKPPFRGDAHSSSSSGKSRLEGTSARFSLIICGFLSPLSLSDFPSCAPTSVALQTRGPHHCLPSPLPPACDFRSDFSGPTPAVAIPNAR